MKRAIVWLRQDLRIADNPALHYACEHYEEVIPVYVLDDITPGEWKMGGAQRWWLHHGLSSLQQRMKSIGLSLILKEGDAKKVIPALVREAKAEAIFWNRCYEPYAIARDEAIKQQMKSSGVEAKSFNGSLLFEPWEIKNKQGSYFKVFTPFWKTCLQQQVASPLPAPKKKKPVDCKSAALSDFDLLPTKPDWAKGFSKHWQPGEVGAQKALDRFLSDALSDYPKKRDVPSSESTSRLSPYLHMGEMSPRQIWHASLLAVEAKKVASRPALDKFFSEIGWREFSYHLIYHFPELPAEPFQSKFGKFPWNKSTSLLKAWRRGQTGYPIVDAGMRELWQTGWMHNRVRMIVASFLTKHLLIPWQEGEAWFWDTLLDADLANNSASWQWVAGSGADAAPYFRIFNPVLQGEKFDGAGEYIRRYVPELSGMPDAFIHRPWMAKEEVLKKAGVVLGKTYPKPVVEHDMARARAWRL